ncbi:MAG TPA: hypothetical protein VIN59_09625 [Alphaproteobacteria bacterium]
MVDFHFPEDKTISLSEEFLVPLGIGNCTITGGFLHADDPLNLRNLLAIAAEGFERADVYWYTIDPEPQRSEHGALARAFGSNPSTVIPPSRDTGPLRLSFTKEASTGTIDQVAKMGYTMTLVSSAYPRLQTT